jgi:NitT/TauT family transport system ATP-binding protein
MTADRSDAPDPAGGAGAGAGALAARGVRIGYGGRTIVDGIALDIARREIVCLLGGSGCGKSTLLRGLAGLEPLQAGAVRFLGEPLTAPHPRAALVFQQPSLLPWLDVRGNVGFGLDFARQPRIAKAARDRRILDAIEAVGLAQRTHAYPSQLSGGQAQRVALARALARQPELLFADEPFSALDAITRAEMQDLLVDLVHRWHTAALLVTHDIDEAILVADRIVLMAGQPGAIVREWRVGLPRPRHAHGADVAALRLEIVGALRSGAAA